MNSTLGSLEDGAGPEGPICAGGQGTITLDAPGEIQVTSALESLTWVASFDRRTLCLL